MIVFPSVLFCIFLLVTELSASLLGALSLDRLLSLDEHQAGVFGLIASNPLQLCDLTTDTSKDVSEVNIYWYGPEAKENEGCKYPIHVAAERLLKEEKFDADLGIEFIYAGFNAKHDDFAPPFLKGYEKKRSQKNLVFIDHYKYTHASFMEFESYRKTINYMHSIAYTGAKFLADCVSQGVPLSKIKVVGHSYGGQSTGVLGQYFKEMTGKLIPRCTGLDPCGPCINTADNEFKLNSGDCLYVESIHTNPGQMGTTNLVSDVDYYANGNISTQPGCGSNGNLLKKLNPDMTCSHIRAIALWLETVYDEDSAYARECSCWDDFEGGRCSSDRVVPTGPAAPTDARGIYIYRTNAEADYGLGRDSANPSNKCKSEKSALGIGLVNL